METAYKIRRRSDGLFSMGGSTPRFTEGGKIWKKKSHLTSHLNQVGGWHRQREASIIYSDCDIVLFELTEKEIDKMTIQEYLEERAERIRKEDEAREKYRDQIAEGERRRLYLKLQEEFEPNENS